MRLIKLLYILINLVFNGALFPGKNRGKRIANCLQRLGPSFIKLGQTLSVRPDIVGKDIAEHLSRLQDKLPPFSYKKVCKTFQKEFGQTPDNIFTSFDKEAIAAASIAQVHKAKTHDGEEIAVKILRPGIAKKFLNEIQLFYTIADIISLLKKTKRLKLREVIATFERSVKKELDLRIEAASASKLKQNCKDDSEIYVPKIYWKHTSRKILAIEWVSGISIYNKAKLEEAGHDLKQISASLAISFFNQVYRDGFFHADIHPGNLFVNSNGQIVPIDFGIMGTLDSQTRLFVAQILKGFLEADYDFVAKVHFDAGYVPSDQSLDDFAIACRAIGEPLLGMPANQISIAKLLALLFKITEDFKMETQPQLLLLQKTMVLLEGVGFNLYPAVNMWQLAEPWMEKWARENLSSKAKVKRAYLEVNNHISKLPGILRKLEDNLNFFDNYKKRKPSKLKYVFDLMITSLISVSLLLIILRLYGIA